MHLDTELPNRIRLEWLMLADYAEVVAGKLYVMGGGWESILGETLPVQRLIAIAVACRVPWNMTNEPHVLEFVMQDEDGNQIDPIVSTEFELGRPPRLPRGHEQRFQMAVAVPARFERTGSYVVNVRLNGEDIGSTNFFVKVRT